MILIYDLIAPYLQQKHTKTIKVYRLKLVLFKPVGRLPSMKIRLKKFPQRAQRAMLCLPTWRGAKSWKSSDLPVACRGAAETDHLALNNMIPSGYVKIALENDHRNSGFTH